MEIKNIIVGDLNILKKPYKDNLKALLNEKLGKSLSVYCVGQIVKPTHWKYLKNGIKTALDCEKDVFHSHSLDEIKAILELWKEDAFNFRFYRVQKRKDGIIILVDYDLETLETSVNRIIEFR